MALDASSLRKIVYKTVEDSATLAGGVTQAKLVEFSAGGFAADIFVNAGIYNFSVEISSEGRYAFSMIDFGAGTDKFYVAANGTSVYLKRTDASDVAKDIGSVTVRKGIRFGEIEDAAIAADSTSIPTGDWRLIDKTYSTQLESLTVDGNFNLRSDLDVNGGDITTTQTEFNLINTNATTLNIGGAATTLNLAAASGTVNINSTVNSTNTTSGALVVDGGIGVANNAYIGSNANVAGTLSVTGASSLTGNVGVGQSSGTEKLEVTGNAKVTSSATTGSSVSVIGNSITSGNLLSLSSTSAAKSSLYGLLSINSSGAKSGSTARAVKIDVSDAGSGANVAFSAVVSGATGSNEGLVATVTSSGNAISEAARLLAYSENGPAVGANIYEVTASNSGDAYGIYQELVNTSYGTAYGANLNVYSSDYEAYGLKVAAVSAAEEDAFSIYAGYGENYLAGNTGIGQLPGTERLEVTGNIKTTGDLAVNGGDITTSSQNLSIGHSGYSGSNPGISIGAIGTTVSIPGNLVVSGTTTYTGSASYNSINITGDLTSSTFPFEIRDTSESPQTVFSVGYNGSMYVRGDTEIDGSLTVDGTSFSIDSTSSSNATVIGATSTASNLTLAAGNSSSGTADVLISAKSEIDLDANAIDLNSDTSVTIDGADFSIDGTASSNITLTGNSGSAVNLTISSTNSGASTGNVLISADDEINLAATAVNITGNLTASNLTVSGTTTTINTTELLISDNSITLNSSYTGSSPSVNAGIEVERGTLDNAAIRWNEGTDRWQFTNDGTNYQNMVTSDSGDISNSEITIEGGTDLEINTSGGANGVFSLNQSTGETITIDHSAVSRTSYTGSTAAPAFGGTFTVIDDVGSSATGHVTSTNLKTVTVPTPADGILDWSTDKYAPYSDKQSSLVHFYTGSAAAPSNTDRLNLDATLWATNVYSGGSEVLTSADLGSSIAQDLQAVTDNGAITTNSITLTDAADLVIEDATATPVTVFSVAGSTGNTFVKGTLRADNAVDFNDNLVVDGANISLDATANSNFTVTGDGASSSDLTLSAANSSSGTASVLISAKTEVDITATTIDMNGAIDIDGTFSADNVTIDGSTISTSTGNLTIQASGTLVQVNDNLSVVGSVTSSSTISDATGTLGRWVLVDDYNFSSAGTFLLSSYISLSSLYSEGRQIMIVFDGRNSGQDMGYSMRHSTSSVSRQRHRSNPATVNWDGIRSVTAGSNLLSYATGYGEPGVLILTPDLLSGRTNWYYGEFFISTDAGLSDQIMQGRIFLNELQLFISGLETIELTVDLYVKL